MNPDKTKAHEKAVEALIGASLRPQDEETEITNEEIDRYVCQRVTLKLDARVALDQSKPALFKKIAELLERKSTTPARTSLNKPENILAFAGESNGPGASTEFVEALVIALLTRHLGNASYPLGRLRYNKMAYFAHRRVEDDVTFQYLKKAAGPYSPWAKYKGPEQIAIKNEYVVRTKVNGREGLVPGPSISKIDRYVDRHPVCAAIPWVLSKLRFKKNDELELLATVDLAVIDLRRAGIPESPAAVIEIIAANPEWAPKLEREVFSEFNISRALQDLKTLFPSFYS
jgi:hypothetical protein